MRLFSCERLAGALAAGHAAFLSAYRNPPQRHIPDEQEIEDRMFGPQWDLIDKHGGDFDAYDAEANPRGALAVGLLGWLNLEGRDP